MRRDIFSIITGVQYRPTTERQVYWEIWYLEDELVPDCFYFLNEV